jgi:hypothetical protein
MRLLRRSTHWWKLQNTTQAQECLVLLKMLGNKETDNLLLEAAGRSPGPGVLHFA